MLLKLMVMMVTHTCGHNTVHFKWVNCKVGELYLKIEKQSQVSTTKDFRKAGSNTLAT